MVELVIDLNAPTMFYNYTIVLLSLGKKLRNAGSTAVYSQFCNGMWYAVSVRVNTVFS